MDWLSMNIEITITLVGSFAFLGFLFKYKANISELSINFLSIFSVKFKFAKNFKNAMEDMQDKFPKEFSIRGASNFDPKLIVHGSPPRNAVLESWSRLENVLQKGNALYSKQSLTKFDAQLTVNLLSSVGLVSPSQATVIINLYNLGKELNDNLNWTPSPDSALYFKHVTDLLVIWLENRIIAKEGQTNKAPRKTTVDSFYNVSSAPTHIHPVAVLTGIKGDIQGKEFNIDKELFFLGANAENDVTISNDDFVSSKHALLQTHAGTLSLADQHSRNGTFLNGKRLTDKPLSVNIGDEIQIGNSTFKVNAK